MHLRARRYHKNRSAFLCLSFFCVTLLREALVYFYALLRAFISVKQFNVFTRFYALLRNLQFSSLLRLQFTPFRVTQFFSVPQLINRQLS